MSENPSQEALDKLNAPFRAIAADQIQVGNLYRHVRTQNLYEVVGRCMVKTDSGDWHDGVMYLRHGENGGFEPYVRTLDNFCKQFHPA